MDDDEGEGKASESGEKKSSSDLLNLDSDNAPVVAPVKVNLFAQLAIINPCFDRGDIFRLQH